MTELVGLDKVLAISRCNVEVEMSYLRERALAKAREPLNHDFGPTLLAAHRAKDPAIGIMHPHTLRRWMIEEGLWTVKARKPRHRKRRERRAVFGELALIDIPLHWPSL